MALTEVVSYDHSITEDGVIQVRRVTRIMKEGIEVAKSYHRHIVNPSDSVEAEDPMTKKLVSVLHTEDCINEFNAKIATGGSLKAEGGNDK